MPTPSSPNRPTRWHRALVWVSLAAIAYLVAIVTRPSIAATVFVIGGGIAEIFFWRALWLASRVPVPVSERRRR